MYHNMTVIECRRSRGYKSETKQVVFQLMYNLANLERREKSVRMGIGKAVIVLLVQPILAMLTTIQRC